MNEDRVEQWRHSRFVAWWTWVSQRGAKDLQSPKEIMRLPGDEDVKKEEVKREDYDQLFDYFNKTWKPPSSPE